MAQARQVLVEVREILENSMNEPLSELERHFRERLLVLFARVDAQQPEKGVQTLLLRAHAIASETKQPLAQVLEAVYQDALERTERRLALLNQCPTRLHDIAD
jgi:hypothetical protein